jgi:hypothetical protein
MTIPDPNRAGLSTFLGLILFLLLLNDAICQLPQEVFWYMQDSSLHFSQGFNITLDANSNGMLGSAATTGGDTVSLEYPVGSGIEHLWAAGLWIGGSVRTSRGVFKRVSTTYGTDGGFQFRCETRREPAYGDSVFEASVGEANAPNRRGFDDDGDGKIDEDELDGHDNDGDWLINGDDLNHNGRPDTGEPHVDEDYGAVSERDLYVAYRDSFSEPRVPSHVPLGVKVWQRSFAWSTTVKEPILPIEYTIINVGLAPIESCFVGILVEPVWRNTGSTEYNQTTGFRENLKTAFFYTTTDPGTTPFGVTLLGSSIHSPNQRIGFRAFDLFGPNFLPSNDNDAFRVLASGQVDSLKSASQRYPILISVGPFGTIDIGDSIRFVVAFLGGLAVDVLPNNVISNAEKAIALYSRGFYPPKRPLSPALRISTEEHSIRLDWSRRPGDPGSDPMEMWDDSNKVVAVLPDTHWRRRDPPPGKSAGGRIFEGFRVWRSTNPTFDENTFSLIYQWDVIDDLNFEGQTGIRFTYSDSQIVRGRRYWYAVTSITIPDYFLSTFQRGDGSVVTDTIMTEPLESPIFQNATQSQLPFTPSTEPNRVKVVPNPYRTDDDYRYEYGGWEGLSRLWTENRRVVWFIHLPSRCTIRIFSLAGEIIKSISHDDSDRQSRNLAVGQEEFELLSESNRALASGIYIYLVESDLGTQTGKFVIIR